MENSTLLETEIAILKTPNIGRVSESVLENLTDQDLLALCRKYGTQAILWKWKFIGLLPEVDRRELYLKKGCSSIYEFAAKFGGVTNEQVRRVISIDKKLAELGLVELRSKLINGEVSLHKLARVISVANGENEKDMLKAVNDLSNRALEVFIKDERNNQMKVLVGDFGGDFPDGRKYGEDMFVHVHKQDYEMNTMVGQGGGGRDEVVGSASLSHTASFAPCVLQDLQELGLSARVVQRLKELKAQGRDINKAMNEMLDKREAEIIEEVEKMSEEVVKKEEVKRENGEEVVRYVPADVKKAIEKRGGDKCEVKGCGREAKHLHHTIRFGIQKSHDPRYIVQLCAEHHQITHVMDGVYSERRKE